MEKDARLFNCIRCHTQTIICRKCDRGQIYCTQKCSKQARKESCQAAGQRYQSTFKGASKHAERQQRYRGSLEEKQKKVTHQGSPPKPLHALLSGLSKPVYSRVLTQNSSVLHCHFCQSKVLDHLRQDFIGRAMPQNRDKIQGLAQGP